MIKIYKYNRDDSEYKRVVNDPSLKGKKRDDAIDGIIQAIGNEVTIREYFKDHDRNSFFRSDSVTYVCFGEPEGCIEKLAYSEIQYDNNLSYCTAKENHPEDLIEERTSWDELEDYADGMYYFIDSLKEEIAAGKIQSWKPSEKQIGALKQWLQDKQYDGDSRYVYPILESLCNDLQKLL